MGWSWMNKPSNQSASDYIRNEMYAEGYKVLDVAIVKLREAYVAVKRPDGQVYCGVIMLGYAPNDHFNFGYKAMDESWQPYYYNCPKRILDLLTPADDANSLKWREACRQVLADKASKPKLYAGAYIVFDTPVSFTNGEELTDFYVMNAQKRLYSKGKGYYGNYKLSKRVFDTRTYKVLSEAEYAAHRQAVTV
jgi:hypothetical protein